MINKKSEQIKFEKVEKAYQCLLESISLVQAKWKLSFYQAFIEQNNLYSDSQNIDPLLTSYHEQLRSLQLNHKEWQKTYQFLLLKANQLEPLQANHQFTPDTIGVLLTFLLDQLTSSHTVSILELGSGTGNLAHTLLTTSEKQIEYVGVEPDELLIDLSASMAEVMESPLQLIEGDAVRIREMGKKDVVISDLPIGYYPDDLVAKSYAIASKTEHTYAHHLLIEAALRHMKPSGLGIFLAPSQLLRSTQAPLLTAWLEKHAQIIATITLPERAFQSKHQSKTIFVLQHPSHSPVTTFVYPITHLDQPEALLSFVNHFHHWQEKQKKCK